MLTAMALEIVSDVGAIQYISCPSFCCLTGEMTNMEDHSSSEDVRILAANPGGGAENTFHVRMTCFHKSHFFFALYCRWQGRK